MHTQTQTIIAGEDQALRPAKHFKLETTFQTTGFKLFTKNDPEEHSKLVPLLIPPFDQ